MSHPAPHHPAAPTSLSRRNLLHGGLALTATAGLGALAAPTASASTAHAHPPVPRVPLGRPLLNAHAHNDYAHTKPLYDALAHGFSSVEADVWLIDGELRLGHTQLETRPGFTLRSAYLEPLDKLASRYRHALPGLRRPLQLLIDLKTDGATTFPAVEAELARFPHLFTEYRRGHVKERSVTAVLSGGRPLEAIAARSQRFSFVDGAITDAGRYSPALVPLVSGNWPEHFPWLGVLPMPRDQRERLEALTKAAHSRRQRIRFYGTPDLPGEARDRLWSQLLASGVDYLNTDDLAGLESFLRSRRRVAR